MFCCCCCCSFSCHSAVFVWLSPPKPRERCVQNSPSGKRFMGDCSNQNKCSQPKSEWMRCSPQPQRPKTADHTNAGRKSKREMKICLFRKKKQNQMKQILNPIQIRVVVYMSHILWTNENGKTIRILNWCHEIWRSRSNGFEDGECAALLAVTLPRQMTDVFFLSWKINEHFRSLGSPNFSRFETNTRRFKYSMREKKKTDENR